MTVHSCDCSILKAITLVIAFSLSGCLVNEPYMRTYDVDINKTISTSEIELFFTEYFLSKGLSIKRKYSVLYPRRSQYIIFEDSHGHKNDIYGFPSIAVVIIEGGKVYLQYEEWFVRPVQPSPSDYIATLRDDLLRKWKQSHETVMEIDFIETDNLYRGFSHDN